MVSDALLIHSLVTCMFIIKSFGSLVCQDNSNSLMPHQHNFSCPFYKGLFSLRTLGACLRCNEGL